jgi:alpha-tubulin suppressor-like RCC1 family protein
MSGSHMNDIFTVNGNVYATGEIGACSSAPGAAVQQKTPFFAGLTNIASVASTSYRNAALKNNGTGYWWGRKANIIGAPVDCGPTSTHQPIPARIPSPGPITDIALTYTDIYFVSGGALYDWDPQTDVLVKVEGVSNVVEIAAGILHLVILDNTGTVYTLSNYATGNQHGQLGNNSNVSVPGAVVATGVTGATSIGAGDYTSYVVLADTTALSWGQNRVGELGNGTKGVDSWIPGPVLGLNGIQKISGGTMAPLALTMNHEVYTWGYHDLILPDVYTSSLVPYKYAALVGIVDVAQAGDGSMTIDAAGQYADWGGPLGGRLGEGVIIERHQAVPPAPFPAVDPNYIDPTEPVPAAPSPVAVTPAPAPDPVVAPVVVPVETTPVASAPLVEITPTPAPVVAAPVPAPVVLTVAPPVVAPVAVVPAPAPVPVVVPSVTTTCPGSRGLGGTKGNSHRDLIEDCNNGGGNNAGKVDPTNPGNAAHAQKDYEDAVKEHTKLTKARDNKQDHCNKLLAAYNKADSEARNHARDSSYQAKATQAKAAYENCVKQQGVLNSQVQVAQTKVTNCKNKLGKG